MEDSAKRMQNLIDLELAILNGMNDHRVKMSNSCFSKYFKKWFANAEQVFQQDAFRMEALRLFFHRSKEMTMPQMS